MKDKDAGSRPRIEGRWCYWVNGESLNAAGQACADRTPGTAAVRALEHAAPSPNIDGRWGNRVDDQGPGGQVVLDAAPALSPVPTRNHADPATEALRSRRSRIKSSRREGVNRHGQEPRRRIG